MKKNYKELQKELLEFLTHFVDLKLDLHYISHEALFDRSLNKKLIIGKDLFFLDAFNLLIEENAWWKNEIRKENIYFSFSKNNEGFNIAFIDDIQKIDAFKKKNHYLLVQTSEKKYQAYFMLDRKVNYFELAKIQKALCFVYKGDIGALSPVQLKRLPSFLNTKYKPHFRVRTVFAGSNKLNVDKVLKFYEDKFYKDFNKRYSSFTYRGEKKVNKTWDDFADSDLSVADMRYTCYLARMGLSDDEIKERLLNESPNIRTRKRNIRDYLDRTIRKARLYVSSNKIKR